MDYSTIFILQHLFFSWLGHWKTWMYAFYQICSGYWPIYDPSFQLKVYVPVCSECNFYMMNEYSNIFASANYSDMNVPIYIVVYIFINECPNIFVHVVYSQMNVRIYSNEKYWSNILADEYKLIVKMRGWGQG